MNSVNSKSPCPRKTERCSFTLLRFAIYHTQCVCNKVGLPTTDNTTELIYFVLITSWNYPAEQIFVLTQEVRYELGIKIRNNFELLFHFVVSKVFARTLFFNSYCVQDRLNLKIVIALIPGYVLLFNYKMRATWTRVRRILEPRTW